MYAVIDLGGKQYRVEKGDELVVDRLDQQEGDTLTLAPLLIGGEKRAVTAGELKGAKVKAKVGEHFLGEKVLVFKYKPKRGYRRRRGHRSRLSRITIEAITAGSAKAVASAGGKKKAASAKAKAKETGKEKKAAATGKAKAEPAKASSGKGEAKEAKAASSKKKTGKAAAEGGSAKPGKEKKAKEAEK